MVVVLALLWPPSAVAVEPAPGVHRPPVDGAPVDLFRPPSGPFGAGNRGLEYRPPPGTVVRASAAGQVVFAGPVGGALHVTVQHPDGLRTSYSFLAAIDVAVGRTVEQGAPLGRSSGILHFGVRAGATYLDPLALFRPGRPAVRLVPDPGSGGASSEAEALLPVVVDALRGDGWAVAHHYLTETDLGGRLARVAGQVTAEWLADDACTPPADAPPAPGGPRVAVLVGGFGSTDRSASVDRVDTVGLGYATDDVVRFSYAGGRVPGRPPTGPLAALSASPYGRDDSQGDLVDAAERLRSLLAAVAAARPGVPIDVLAHSQGGVVAQIALTDLTGGPPLPASLDLVATMGAPHDGADLATAVAAVHDAPRGPVALEALEDHLSTGLDPAAPAVAQLSEVSPLLANLGDRRPPEGVRLLGIGARGDLVVPAGHTRLWDGAHQVVDLVGRDAHRDLPGDPATARELALAIAGAPPTCRDALDVLADAALPEAISLAEDSVGAAAWALAWTT
jgi:hypothetical protein